MENEVESVKRYSLAKLTATLRILDKREDGYNNLEALTVFLPEVSDKIEISLNGTGKFDVASQDDIPTSQDNLVVRSTALFFANERVNSKFELEENTIDVFLEKSIPVAAGLGGGSADAAATLNALNYLCENELTPTELSYIAEQLGSDVPACLYSQALIMKGRGEIIDLLDDFYLEEVQALVVTPNIYCSTPSVYEHYDKIGRPKDEGSDAPAEMKEFTDCLVNDLSLAAFDLYSDLADLRSALETTTGLQFSLAGSGSTFFAFADPEKIQDALLKINDDFASSRFRLCAYSPIV